MSEYRTQQEQIRLRRAAVSGQYPQTWKKIIAEWSEDSPEDCAWLMYSANYLLRTGNIRWAIDPLTLKNRLPLAPAVPAAHDLEKLSFVLLTHFHADHLDFGLLHDLRELPIRWVIPEWLVDQAVSRAGLPQARIWIPKIAQPLELDGLRVTPFAGLHGKIPAIAYQVEFGGKRWLFPGDTREYESWRLPFFEPVDVLFAHLWLGKGCALDENPALLASFGRFILDLQPRRIVVTHLEELAREAPDYWDWSHYLKVEKWFQDHRPDIPVEGYRMGEKIVLATDFEHGFHGL